MNTGFLRAGSALLAASVVALATVVFPVPAVPTPNGTWTELGPPARSLHAAIYDPVRDRMLVIAGNVWALDLSPGASWHPLAVSGTPPATREWHSAIYDPIRDRVLVFGGGDGTMTGMSNDTWELTLGSGPAWNQLIPSGSAPPARIAHGAIYDPVRDRMIVFGGESELPFPFNPYLNDVWALSLGSTPAWTQLAPTGTKPAVRAGANVIYDADNDRLVLFGGNESRDLFVEYQDAWALSLGSSPAWTRLTPTGTAPDGRSHSATIYDPVRGRMVLFGGTGIPNDTWSLSLGTTPAWTNLAPPAPPEGRAYSTGIYDPVRDRMLMFGGSGYFGVGSDTWALSLDGGPEWSVLVPGVAVPRRTRHTMVLDSQRNRAVVFGGWTNEFAVWTLSLGTLPAWSALPAVSSGPPPGMIYEHAAVYDPLWDRMIVFGGSNGGNTWQLTFGGTPTWTKIDSTGPAPRNGAAAAYDPVGQRMILFGGTLGTDYGDTWSLDLSSATTAWTPIAAATHPSPRGFAQMVYDPVGERMILFGGFGTTYLNDTWALSLGATPAWTQPSPGGNIPVVRLLHALSYDSQRGRVILNHGYGLRAGNSYGPLGDSHGLDLGGGAGWSALASLGDPPGPREGLATLYDPGLDRIVMFGGGGTGPVNSELWLLSFLDGPAPTPASLVSAEATPSGVDLAWQAREEETPSAALYRRATGGQWQQIATVAPDPQNQLAYQDTEFQAGTSYDYVLGFRAAPGEQYSEVAHVDAPTVGVDPEPPGALAIRSARFQGGALIVSFTLPGSEPARIDLFDVAGRRVARRELPTPAGVQEASLEASSLGAGVFWVRLSQGRATRVAKAALIR